MTDDKQSADFVDGFSAALQAAESVIWRLEDDAFLYDTVSDAMRAVISELQDMERNWTGRVSMAHRSELLLEIDLLSSEADIHAQALDELCWIEIPEEKAALEGAIDFLWMVAGVTRIPVGEPE